MAAGSAHCAAIQCSTTTSWSVCSIPAACSPPSAQLLFPDSSTSRWAVFPNARVSDASMKIEEYNEGATTAPCSNFRAASPGPTSRSSAEWPRTARCGTGSTALCRVAANVATASSHCSTRGSCPTTSGTSVAELPLKYSGPQMNAYAKQRGDRIDRNRARRHLPAAVCRPRRRSDGRQRRRRPRGRDLRDSRIGGLSNGYPHRECDRHGARRSTATRLLSPQTLERIISAVLSAIDERQLRKDRSKADTSVTSGVASEQEQS